MRRYVHAAVLGLSLALAAATSLSVREADAAAAYESPYTFDQTWGTALRMLRVDLGLKITEKDSENGYLLFEYKSPESGSRVSGGSIEMVRTRDGVHCTVQLPAMPSYHEQVIADGLAKKLASEHGEPPKRPRPTPAPPADDAGSDAPPP